MAKSVGSIIQHPNGKFSLSVMDEDPSVSDVFEERGLQGGGYTWEGVIRALIEMRMPNALPQLEIGAEADNAYVDSDRRDLLEQLSALIVMAIEDPELLTAAIDHAGEDLE